MAMVLVAGELFRANAAGRDPEAPREARGGDAACGSRRRDVRTLVFHCRCVRRYSARRSRDRQVELVHLVLGQVRYGCVDPAVPPLVFVRCRDSHFHLLNACFVCLPSIATVIAVVDRAIAPRGLVWREDSLGYALWRRAVLARRSACVLDFLTSRCTRRSVVVVVFSTRCRSASSSSRGFSSLAASRGANPCPARIATGDARAARARAPVWVRRSGGSRRRSRAGLAACVWCESSLLSSAVCLSLRCAR